LQTGFPWHTPETTHCDIRSADEWWRRLNPVFVRAFAGVGLDGATAERLVGRVRTAFCDVKRYRL
jgi:putative hydrolase of the HAD superfamily